ncbi:MAG TPA: von Willebrand factor type A domain-containing protein, partial [Phycisphaerae bacterium]|nr:von Willebrand factor type A domain-containing protein [Phycisphaerae bacterium]
MRTSPCDDPRLTAYALGELDDLEAAGVARWLETTPDARQALGEIRRTIDRVSTVLSAEASGAAAPALSDEQRAALHRAIDDPRMLVRQHAAAGITPRYAASKALSVFWLGSRALAAAAVLTLALTAPWHAPPANVHQQPAISEVDGDPDTARTDSLIVARFGQASVNALLDALGEASPGHYLAFRGVTAAPDTAGSQPGSRSLYLYNIRATDESSSFRAPPDVLRVPLVHSGEATAHCVGLFHDLVPGDVPGLETLGRRVEAQPSGSYCFVVGYPVELMGGPVDWLAVDADGDGLIEGLPMHWLVERGAFDVSYDPPATERYARVVHNPFLFVERNPLSTFSVDVDTASYANVRRYINEGLLPPPAAVRIEELVNYFAYDDAPPPAASVAARASEGGSNAEAAPIALHVEMSECPWAPAHRLMRVALKAREVDLSDRPPANIVLLIDVSGSMDEPDRLPLIKEALGLLVERLGPQDSLSIVSYAAEAQVVLRATRGDAQHALLAAIDSLVADGGTNGGAGLELAYEIATGNRIAGGENRVILATDGDFNVGVTDDDPLAQLVRERAVGGVFLTVLGVGRGNFRDQKLELLANRGNGHYRYLDTL